MSEGWISLHRQIWDNEYLWDDKPFARGQAWIDLLMLVNHADNETVFNKQPLLIKRGQRVTSIRILAERWGWSRQKVSDFLNSLVSLQMLKIEKDTKKTVITIANYDFYQDVTNKKSHQKATKKPPSDINNNDNNDNNTLTSELAEREPDEKTIFEHRALLAAEYIAKMILQRTPNYPHLRADKKDKTINGWAKDIEKLLRIDRVDFEEFKIVLRFSQHDEFWRQNILSGAALRKQYGAMLVRIGVSDD